MNIQKHNLGLLGSFVILVTVLVGNSSAEFYWKDNKIVRQAELANDILLKDTPITLQSTLNSLNSVNSIVVGDAQKQLATQAGIVPQPTQMPVVNDLQSIKFDCTGKPTGPNKDPKYCDVYHACVFGKQSKVYSCEQMGERFYYDENLQRCEFASNNPQACPSNTYFQSVRTQLAPISRQYGQDTSNSNSYSASQPSSQSSYSAAATGGSGTQYGASQYPSSYPSGGSSYPSGGSSYPSGGSGGSQYPSSAGQTLAPWQQYVEQNEQFSCQGKQDGFYPSKWCNVFYRCFYGIKSDFLCAMNNDGARLWWTAHSTSQAVPQQSAQCVFPCQQKRQCTSPGGVLMDGPTPSDSPQAAQQILSSCPVNANYNPNPSGVPVPDNSNDQVRIPDGNNYCQGAPDGVQIADPNFCNVFHVCIAGIRKDQVCAKGPGGQYDLWWNDATKRCDYPCTTQCSKGIYGSQANAQQIQSMDRAMNPSMCGGSSSYPSGGSSGSYPSGGSSYPSYGSSSYGGSSSGSAAAPSYGSSSGSSYPSSSGSSSYGASPSYSSSGSSSSYGASPSYSSSGSSSSYAQPAQQPSYGSSQSSYTYGTTQQSQNYGSGSGSYGTSQQSYGK